FERAGAYAPAPLLFRAKAYAGLDDYEAAIEDLKKAIQYAQSQPQILPEIQNTRAEIYMEVGGFQAALPDLQAATQANRSNPRYQFNLGKTLVKLGGAAPGEKALTKYLDAEIEGEEERRAEALLLRATAYGGLRKFEEAEADIEASLAIDPDNHEPYFTRAQISLQEKDYDAAAADLQQAIERYQPEDEDDEFPFVQGALLRASIFEEMGKEAAREGDDAAAMEAYANCKKECDALLASIDEDDPRTPQVRVATLFRRGVAERLLGELGAAVKSFSQTLELDPYQGEAYFRRGICFHFMGEEKLAIRDFEQAASINFDSPRANLWKGMSWAKLGRYDEAIRAYGESISVSDRYTPAYVNRGLAHMANGDPDKAVDDLNEAIRLQPTEALHYYRRGTAQARVGDSEKAIQSFMNAIEFDTRLRPAYDALATELEATGQSGLASEYRRRAAQLN
ncbi:MAG: tetratricopeptide repeat protein, partial [Planctomycetota bacterium]